MKSWNGYLIATLCLFGFCSGTPVFASSEVVGTVIQLKGQASIIPFGSIKEKRLNINDPIARGDSIQTKAKTILKIEMADHSLLVFGPKTRFNLREFVFTPDKLRKSHYELLQGQMRAKIAPMKSGENNVEIHTRSVSLGIRGTEVLINELPKGRGKFQTQATLLSGTAHVYDKVSKKLSELFPGAMFVSDAGKPGDLVKEYLPKDTLEKMDRALKPPAFDPNAADFALAGAKEDNRSVHDMAGELFLPSVVITPKKLRQIPAKKEGR